MPSDLLCTVVDQQLAGRDLYRLWLRPAPGQPTWACTPGQFVMLDLPTERFAFRRPFSLCRVALDGTFELYYKVVGYGTDQMARFRPGDAVRVLGPLGIGFPTPVDPVNTLLIAGGIGIAPMVMVADGLPEGQRPQCFYGARNAQELGLVDVLTGLMGAERVHLSTDDGSEGVHGNVCSLLRQQADAVARATEAFVCGPTPMMRAVAELLAEMNPALRVYVSLEEHMPCGTGACSSCVVGRTDRLLPSKTCVEGPVFDARLIAWTFPTEEGAACPA